MLFCQKCKVKVSTLTSRCPLCSGPLEKLDDNPLTLSYPPYQNTKYRIVTWFRILSFVVMLAIFVVTLVNLLLTSKIYWFIIVDSCLIYIWLACLITFKIRNRWGLKLFLHALMIIALLIVINAVMEPAESSSPITWALSYGMPIISMTFIALIVIIMLIKRQTRREFMIHLLLLCIIGFVPLILVLFDLVQPIILSIVSASLSYATLLGLVIFANRIVETEIKRKFHI